MDEGSTSSQPVKPADAEPHIQQLENRYIQLLETRIAGLEALALKDDTVR